MIDFPSFERSRISGKKKVNEFKDGFLILISILKLFINKKMKKVALITGITGQDGSYLAELLLKKLYCSWFNKKIINI